VTVYGIPAQLSQCWYRAWRRAVSLQTASSSALMASARIVIESGKDMGTPVIGFLGLGAMGSRVAGRLLDSGKSLYGTDPTKSAAEGSIEQGLRWRETPRKVAVALTGLQHGCRYLGARRDHLRSRRNPRWPVEGQDPRGPEHREPPSQPKALRSRPGNRRLHARRCGLGQHRPG
jgi:hypothetical protein